MNQTTMRYGRVAMALHWLVAVLIVVQFVLAARADGLPLGMEKLQVLAIHKSFGITILGLAILRLAWRLAVPPPPLPATVPAWQARASRLMHWLLYALLFSQPVSGWALSSAANFSVSWFNLVQLPDLVAPDEPLSERLEGVHEILGRALFVLAAVHIAAALKHRFVDRDGVLARMLPRPLGEPGAQGRTSQQEKA